MTTKITDLDAFVNAWCAKAGIPEAEFEDYIQESWVAALESGHNRKDVRRALNRYKHNNYVKQLKCTLGDPDTMLAVMGHECDNYNGFHRDDT